MILLLVLIILDTLNHGSIIHAHALHQRCEVLHAKVPVRASVSLAGAWRVLCENLLATEGAVAASPPVGITTNVAICVTNIVPVVLVEGIVGNLVEAASPEHERLLQIETNVLEEEAVL